MSTPKTRAFSTRLSEEDRKIIQRAADLMGITSSRLIREGAVAEAKKIVGDPEAFAISRVRRLIREHRSELDKMMAERAENLGSHASKYDPIDARPGSACQCSDCTVAREDDRSKEDDIYCSGTIMREHDDE